MFKAELDRHIVTECEDQARILCTEDPDKRLDVIQQLRDLVLGSFFNSKESFNRYNPSGNDILYRIRQCLILNELIIIKKVTTVT